MLCHTRCRSVCARSRFSVDCLGVYLSDIDEVKLLSREQEIDLANAFKNGDLAARERLIRANLRLVVKVCRYYTGQGLSLDDLIQYGNIGLIRAVEKFDASKGFRFSTYAVDWIMESVRSAIRTTADTIRIPGYMKRLKKTYMLKLIEMEQESGREPTFAEVSVALKLRPKQSEILRHYLGIATRSLTSLPREEEVADDTERQRSRQMRSEYIRSTLASLPPSQRSVLELRYGLTGEQPMYLSEIGQRLRPSKPISKEGIRQLEKTALTTLREFIREE